MKCLQCDKCLPRPQVNQLTYLLYSKFKLAFYSWSPFSCFSNLSNKYDYWTIIMKRKCYEKNALQQNALKQSYSQCVKSGNHKRHSINSEEKSLEMLQMPAKFCLLLALVKYANSNFAFE